MSVEVKCHRCGKLVTKPWMRLSEMVEGVDAHMWKWRKREVSLRLGDDGKLRTDIPIEHGLDKTLLECGDCYAMTKHEMATYERQKELRRQLGL